MNFFKKFYNYLFLLFSSFILCSCNFPNHEKIEVPIDGYNLHEVISNEWDNVCFSSQYELPDLTIGDYAGKACWGNLEIPNKQIAISFIHRDRSCTRKMINAHFLSPQNSESRCFSYGQSKNLKIIIENDIIKFKVKQ